MLGESIRPHDATRFTKVVPRELEARVPDLECCSGGNSCQHRITFPHFRRSKFPHPVAVAVISRGVMRRAPFVAGRAGA